MKPWRKRIAVYSLLTAVIVGISWYFYWDATRTKEPQVIYVSTPPDAVERMLEMAQVTKDDVVYDLGCGDGRIVVAAAKKYGCRAVGVELRAEAVEDARRNVAEAGVEDLVEIRQADILTTDFSDATVVAMYLLPDFNVRLIPKLNQLPPGSRVVSYTFKMPGVPPKEKAQWKEGANERTVYLWTTPIPAPVPKP
ncbi:MAG: SAM-dependent methyltransferase [Pirellulaceae bacterium]